VSCRRAAISILAVASAALLASGACAPVRQPRDVVAERSAPPVAAAAAQENPPVMLNVPDDPTITFKVWFRVGSQDDPVGREGLAWITGRMLAEAATRDHVYEKILELLYPLASSYDVSVDREMTVLSGRTHRDNFERFHALFTAAFTRPAFAATDFQRIKTDTLNYLRNSLRFESDEELAKAALYGFIFDGTRYAHPPQGTVAGVEAITLDDVRSFYARFFTRARTTVALGGGFDGPLARRFASSVQGLPVSPAGSEAPPAVPPAAFDGRQVLLVAKPDADASISFGFPLEVRRGERDFYALWLANAWLGEHRNSSSHLFKVIRERRGLNYGDYSYIEAFPEGGRRQFPPPHIGRRQPVFEVWIRTLPNRHAHFALRAAMRELETLAERGMTAEQFELTRAFLSKYVLHFADTTSARLGYAIDDRFYGLEGEGHLARFQRIMGELTLAEVNSAIARHLRPERVKIAVVTGDATGLAAALAAEAPSPIEYPNPKSDEIVAEDAVISSYPLRISPGGIRTVELQAVFER
jgi:zinc protease